MHLASTTVTYRAVLHGIRFRELMQFRANVSFLVFFRFVDYERLTRANRKENWKALNYIGFEK